MKKKLLIVTYHIPYPLTQGGRLAQYFFIERLHEYFDTFIYLIANTEQDLKVIEELKKNIPALKVFVYNNIPGNRRQTLKGKLKRYLTNLNRDFFGLEKKDAPDYNEFLDIRPIQFVYIYGQDYIRSLNDIIFQNGIQIVQFDFYETLSLLNVVHHPVKKIFVHHEIRYKKFELASVNNAADISYKKYITDTYRTIEPAFLSNADKVLVFNEDDKNLLSASGVPVAVSPFGIPSILLQKKSASKVFTTFLFIGGQFHTPNYDGITWFLEKVYIPFYDEIPFDLKIVGDWSKEFAERFAAYDRISFEGQVPDLLPFYDSSILISPIFSGSGLRTKIIQALANFVPVFTTRFGAEGILNDHFKRDYIGLFEDEQDFMSLIKKYQGSHESLSIMAKDGNEFYNAQFGYEKLFQLRVNAIENM